MPDLMREHNPLDRLDFDPDAPTARAALEQILMSPPEAEPARPGVRRRLAPRVAAVAGVAAIAGGGVALMPSSGGGGPDVLASAIAALQEPDTIIHYRTTVDTGGFSMTTETWQASDGRSKRELLDGGRLESVFDLDTKTDLGYSKENDTLIRHTDPDLFRGPQGLDAPVPYAAIDLVDLKQLFERAKAGAADVEIVGERTVRGIETHELRLRLSSDRVRDARGGPLTWTRTIHVDRDTFLPVRMSELGRTTDFSEMETIERTPATERLLRMSPHPGAKQETEGPV